MPLFALKIFPGVNASSDKGPYSRALMGSMSPSKSSAVKSGEPWILMNRCFPLMVLVFCVWLLMHCGHRGSFGVQWKSQSATVISGKSSARFLTRVVFPIPGGPTRIRCLPMINALFRAFLTGSCPIMSLNGCSLSSVPSACGVRVIEFGRKAGVFKYF